MIFAVLILVVLGAITFIHYIQGFFSATISAILAVVAALFAFSYHESLVPLFGGKAADYSTGISLLVLFGLIYILLRLAFDKAVPGNIRLPVTADKIGAAVMGLIAGIFGTGIMAIAASEMPFSANIAGFTRFDTAPERQVKVETRGKSFYSKNFDELTTSTPGSPGDEPQGVKFIPVDNIVVNLVDKLSSEAGPLQNGKPLYTVHPDFLSETFAQRLGIEPSASHTAVNLPSAHVEQVKLLGLFSVSPKIPQADGELNIRSGGPLKPIDLKGSEMFVAMRLMFSQQAADADSFVRFSPGSVRLLLHDPSASAPEDQYKNYYPIGTMEGTGKLFLQKLDDYLICKQGNGADVVFKLPKKSFEHPVEEGAFLEVKRWARFDLGGMKIEGPLTPNPEIVIARKQFVLNPEESSTPPTPNAAPAPTAKPSSPPANTSKGFRVDTSDATNALAVDISLAQSDSNALLQVPGGTAKLDNGKLKNINMDASRLELNAGSKITEFAVPSGMGMVQINGAPGGPANAIWAVVTDPEQYELVDGKDKHFPPNGIVVVYRGTSGERVKIRYFDSTTISGSAAPEGADPATKVVLLYNIPLNTHIIAFHDHGQKTQSVDVTAK